MNRVSFDCIYGINHGQIMYRTRGVELAPNDRQKPLRKPDDPIALHGIHLGEFAVFFSVKTALLKPRYTTASYLITQVNRRTQQALALPGDAVLQHPEVLCSPYLRYVLEDVELEDLADFGLDSLGEYITQASTEPPVATNQPR